MSSDTHASAAPVPGGKTVLVEFDDGIAWVSMNRPEKRNAISAELAHEMFEVVDALEVDDRCKVMVLTGTGDAFSAGMDCKDYFRASDKVSPQQRARSTAPTPCGSGGASCITPSRPSPWSMAGASAARSRR